jgi:hypothetical protein
VGSEYEHEVYTMLSLFSCHDCDLRERVVLSVPLENYLTIRRTWHAKHEVWIKLSEDFNVLARRLSMVPLTVTMSNVSRLLRDAACLDDLVTMLGRIAKRHISSLVRNRSKTDVNLCPCQCLNQRSDYQCVSSAGE